MIEAFLIMVLFGTVASHSMMEEALYVNCGIFWQIFGCCTVVGIFTQLVFYLVS